MNRKCQVFRAKYTCFTLKCGGLKEGLDGGYKCQLSLFGHLSVLSQILSCL